MTGSHGNGTGSNEVVGREDSSKGQPDQQDGLSQIVLETTTSAATGQGFLGYTKSGFNDDDFATFSVSDEDGNERYRTNIVADGMSQGGHGSIASRLTTRIAKEYLLQELTTATGLANTDLSPEEIKDSVGQAYDLAHETVRAINGFIRVHNKLPSNGVEYVENHLMIPVEKARKHYFERSKALVAKAIDDTRKSFQTSNPVIVDMQKRGYDMKLVDQSFADRDKIELDGGALATSLSTVVHIMTPNSNDVTHVIGNTGDSEINLATETGLQLLSQSFNLATAAGLKQPKRDDFKSDQDFEAAKGQYNYFSRTIYAGIGANDTNSIFDSLNIGHGNSPQLQLEIIESKVPIGERYAVLVATDGITEKGKLVVDAGTGDKRMYVPLFDGTQEAEADPANLAQLMVDNAAVGKTKRHTMRAQYRNLGDVADLKEAYRKDDATVVATVFKATQETVTQGIFGEYVEGPSMFPERRQEDVTPDYTPVEEDIVVRDPQLDETALVNVEELMKRPSAIPDYDKAPKSGRSDEDVANLCLELGIEKPEDDFRTGPLRTATPHSLGDRPNTGDGMFDSNPEIKVPSPDDGMFDDAPDESGSIADVVNSGDASPAEVELAQRWRSQSPVEAELDVGKYEDADKAYNGKKDSFMPKLIAGVGALVGIGAIVYHSFFSGPNYEIADGVKQDAQGNAVMTITTTSDMSAQEIRSSLRIQFDKCDSILGPYSATDGKPLPNLKLKEGTTALYKCEIKK